MDDPTDIFAWRRRDARLTTSGQPTEAQLASLVPLGVTHVVNLALHDHERALPDEAASVAALGLTYAHIPVAFDQPTEADFARFCDLMDELGDATVHVHCIVNARVTAFLYRYDTQVRGLDAAPARAAMESVWKPGGVWARFVGDEDAVALPNRFAGRDY